MIFFFFFWLIGSKLLLFINYLEKQLKILINYILQPHYAQIPHPPPPQKKRAHYDHHKYAFNTL